MPQLLPPATILEEARRRAGISQERLAERYRAKTGQSASIGTIGAWMRDHRQPSISEYLALASVINEEFRNKGEDYTLPVFQYRLKNVTPEK